MTIFALPSLVIALLNDLKDRNKNMLVYILAASIVDF